MSNNFYKKFPTVDFTIKNVSSQQKSISVFGLTIPYNRTANLMAIPEITEAEIKASLTKGELSNKIRANDIKIVSSTLNLLEFNTDFRDFIDNANIASGDPVSGTDPYTQVGGGGGGTTIADGGTLSGTYDGDVLCLGSATLTADVTVNGTLTVLGTFYNEDRYELNVVGNLHAHNINFNSNDDGLSQSNFTVGGDLLFSYMDFVQTGGGSALLKVGGNLLGNTGANDTLNAYGAEGCPGLNIIVYGNMHIGYVFLYGGDSDETTAGNGGNLTIYGNLHVTSELNIYGGDSEDYNAGNGGEVEVYGNFTMGEDSYSVDFGGSATNGNAGDGGTLRVSGSCVLTNNDGDVDFWGGDCYSDNENHRAGSGGNIYIEGSLVCDTDIELGGGDRYGTLSSSGSVVPPHGGNLTVRGDARVDEIDCDGGYIDTSNFAPCVGGNGGDIDVHGNLTITEEIYSQGSDSQYSNGGNGGNIDVGGNLVVNDVVYLSGGISNNGSGGNGGYINIRGSFYSDDSVDIYGGYGTNGNGGNGGNIYVDGELACGDLDASGGNCNSTNEIHHAGSGGDIYTNKISMGGNVYLDAGERTGNTTVSNTGNSVGYAGSLNVDGDCLVGLFSSSGGIVDTNYPNGAGTKGGEISVDGNLICDQIDIEGGYTYGNNAGRAGSIYVQGALTVTTMNCYGGDSYNSAGVGSDAGISGAGPLQIYARGGINAKYCYFSDGAGDGSAPSNTVTLLLSGNNTIYELDMTNRAQVIIKPEPLKQCTLKLGLLSDKVTLNNTSDVESTDISGDVDDHLYISDGTTWYGIAGSTIFA